MGLTGVAASGVMPRLLAQPPVTPGGYLWIKGILSPDRSLADLTRVYLKAPIHYLEFPTRPTVFASAGYVPTNHIDAYVPIWSNLYFSDDPAPTVASAPALNTLPVFQPQHFQGRVLADGSPATVFGKAYGVPTGVSGRLKTGSNVSIQLTVSTAQFGAGQSMPQLAWAFCRATISKDSDPPLIVAFGFSPEALTGFLGVTYGNRQTSLLAQLASLADNSQTFILQRFARYYGLLFSQQSANSAASSASFAMPLAASAIGTEWLRVSNFWPVLAAISPTTTTPGLASIGSLEVGQGDSRSGYIERAAPYAAGLLPALASSMSDPSHAGWPALAHWLGSAIVAERTSLQNALGATYDAFEKLRNSSSPGNNWHKLPTMKDNDSEDLSDQILDWAAEHKS